MSRTEVGAPSPCRARDRSEEHTSELQSRQYLVCRLLLEKKNHTRLVCLTIPEQPTSRSPSPAHYVTKRASRPHSPTSATPAYIRPTASTRQALYSTSTPP